MPQCNVSHITTRKDSRSAYAPKSTQTCYGACWWSTIPVRALPLVMMNLLTCKAVCNVACACMPGMGQQILHCPGMSLCMHRVHATEHECAWDCPGGSKVQDLDTVSRLMDLFGDSLRDWHAKEAPGSERESRVLESKLVLPAQMALLNSRDDTYECLLVNLARIFRRWRERRKGTEAAEFAHGLAHMVILSCLGSGAPSDEMCPCHSCECPWHDDVSYGA